MLRAAGHEVCAPTLSGLADRRHLLSARIDLATHGDDVANLLVYEDLSSGILVGHSYAGMAISGVAVEVRERLGRVVHLDAHLPEAGHSAVDLWPEERRGYAERADPTGEGLAQPPPLALFGVTDPVLAAPAEARMTPHPDTTYRQPTSAALNVPCGVSPGSSNDWPLQKSRRARSGPRRHLAAGGPPRGDRTPPSRVRQPAVTSR